MKKIINASMKFGLLIFLSLFFTTFVFSQCRGKFCFAKPKAKNVKANGISGYTLGSVGGIMFENIASPVDQLTINNLQLHYNPAGLDGKRMELTVNGGSVIYPVYDWQLIPVARYANSNYTACFTYFGELNDKALEELVLNNDGHILNYHPDLANTVLGWRLADMDMLILYEFTSDLPKIDGKYVLGAGETNPDVNANNYGAYLFINYLNSIGNDLGYEFRSYVLTDNMQKTTFFMRNDSLKISGYPYYYCWKLRNDAAGFSLQHVQDSINLFYQNKLNEQLQMNPGFYERGLYIDSLISLSYRYQTSFQIYASGTFVDLVEIGSSQAKRDFLEQYTTGSLRNMLISVSANMYAYQPVYLKEFSDRMSAYPEMIEACNPAVWNATVSLMRTAAFFRYIKQQFPAQWQSFMNQISAVSPEPAVITPTVIYDSGNTLVEEACNNSAQVFSDVKELQPEIVIFPNPAGDFIHIQNLSGVSRIEFFSTEGKALKISETDNREETIFLNNLPPGNYTVQIKENNQIIFTKKIIKK